MNIVNKFTAIICIVFTMLFFSCQKEVEVKLPESKYKIVLNCILSNDSLIKVSITRSKKLYVDDNANTNIENATVSIYENGVFIENLPHIKDDIYQSSTFKPTIDNAYKIVVKANGYDEASATETLIKQAIISNIVFKDSALIKPDGALAQVSFDIADPSGINNYYELEVVSIGTMPDYSTPDTTDFIKTQYPLYLTITDELLKENFKPDISGQSEYNTSNLQFSDKYFDGKQFSVKVYFSSYELDYSDSMLVNVKSVSKSYYEYKRTVLEQINSDGPFSEPVRVYTNVTGGTGILGSYSQTKKYFVK